MQWLARSAALVALVGALLATHAQAAPGTAESKCKAVKVCYPGSKSNAPCTISDGNCSPCMDFSQDLCFAKVGDKCTFSTWVDCTKWFSISSGSTSSGSGDKNTVSNTTTTAPTSSSSSSKNAADAGTDTKSKSSSGVIVIIGAACGVIAVAAIFLVLVRRSRTPDEDIDEMETPSGLSKAPGSTTHVQNAQYAQFAQARPVANPTTPTNRVVQYYHDNAQPSPRVSTGKTGFGTAVPAQQGLTKVVRPAPSANAPTFFAGPTVQGVQTVEAAYAPAPGPMEDPVYARTSGIVYTGVPAPAPEYAVPAPDYGAPAGGVEYGMPSRDTTPGVIMHMHAEHVNIPAAELEVQQPDQALSPARRDSFEF